MEKRKRRRVHCPQSAGKCQANIALVNQGWKMNCSMRQRLINSNKKQLKVARLRGLTLMSHLIEEVSHPGGSFQSHYKLGIYIICKWRGYCFAI
ncbi:hypothetical protein HHUSO_G2399 [Huso huso]|uniref:Uncharacterized protein n=1 Tax=Huso huso TaxID=61971 RepID=A0ABR1A7U4_HUSHU